MKKTGLLVFVISLVASVQLYANAADVTLKDLAESPVKSESLISGKRKILFFWASWCHFCRKELDNLPAQADFLKKNNIELIAINVSEPVDAVKKFKEKSGFPFTIFLDDKGLLSDAYHVLGIPTFVYLTDGNELDRNNYFSPVQTKQIFKIGEKAGEKKEEPKTTAVAAPQAKKEEPAQKKVIKK